MDLTATRRAVALIACIWVLTRLLGAWLADHPDLYEGITGDVAYYLFWAEGITTRGLAPYEQIRIEYPPGSLPFITAPMLWVARGGSYRTAFVALMVAVDAFGLAGLLSLARRWGSLLGPVLWVVALPLLGPLCYARLDLVPAVATIWAIERASAGAWTSSGAWLGFGAIVKLYPALLVPGAMLASRRPLRLLGAVVLVAGIALAPLAGSYPELVASVLGYHAQRGIQIESTWGLLLMVASRFGYAVALDYNFGAFHVTAGIAPLLKPLALCLSIAGLAVGTWRLRRTLTPGDVATAATGLFGTLALILAVGSVLSPQFLMWVIALGAAAACALRPEVRRAVIPLPPAAFLSQLIYPFDYSRLLEAGAYPLFLLAVRNVLIAAAGAAALAALARPSRVSFEVGPAPAPALSGGPGRRSSVTRSPPPAGAETRWRSGPPGGGAAPTSGRSETSATGGSRRSPRIPRRRSR